MIRPIRLTLPAILGAALLVGACSGEPEHEYRTVTLNGNVRMLAGPLPEGTITMRLYNLWYLDGELRHPLEEIEDVQVDSGQFTHTFEYPLHKGTGLAVHAWLDADGDGVFCTPNSRTDPAGLTAMEETPEGEVPIEIVLTDNCRAANFFYPPAE